MASWSSLRARELSERERERERERKRERGQPFVLELERGFKRDTGERDGGAKSGVGGQSGPRGACLAHLPCLLHWLLPLDVHVVRRKLVQRLLVLVAAEGELRWTVELASAAASPLLVLILQVAAHVHH